MNENQPQNLSMHAPFVAVPIDQRGRVSTHAYLEKIRLAACWAMAFFQTQSLTAEVFVRHRFGERYLDPMAVAFGYFLLVFAGVFLAGASGMAGETSWGLLLYAHAYLIAVIIHKVAIFHRNMKGERWHSQCEGISYRLLTIPAYWIAGLIARLVPTRLLGDGYRQRMHGWALELAHLKLEPVFVFVVGLLISPLDGGLGLYLAWAGMAMALKGELKRMDDRRNILDLIDQSIEAEHQKDVAQGLKEPEQAEGFHVYGTSPFGGEHQTIASAFARLDPALRDLTAAANDDSSSHERRVGT